MLVLVATMDATFDAFKEGVMKGFFDLTLEAESRRDEEFGAACCIQSHYRAFVVRMSLKRLHTSAVVIQKHLRAHLARKLYTRMQEDYIKSLRLAYFNHNATMIQKWFRGYFSRKYMHDFHARKGYIKAVTTLSSRMVLAMRANHKRQVESLQKEEIDKGSCGHY